MFIFFIVLACVTFYSLMAGMTFKGIEHFYREACETKVFGAIFWPLALPIGLGILLFDKIGTPENRTERRHEREVAEARHQEKLARIQTEKTRAVAEENAILDRMR